MGKPKRIIRQTLCGEVMRDRGGKPLVLRGGGNNKRNVFRGSFFFSFVVFVLQFFRFRFFVFFLVYILFISPPYNIKGLS